MDENEILAVVQASPARRWVGIGALGGVGLFSLWIALAQPPEPMWLAFLVVLGAGALWMAERMWRATERHIELTATELRDSTGEVIALVADVASVDRGAFAFKPSNGFVMKLKRPGGRRWLPGLWWRSGRRVGVGGVTPGHQAKLMADILAAILAGAQTGSSPPPPPPSTGS